MNNLDLIYRTETMLEDMAVDVNDFKSVAKYEKLVKLWLALQRARKKDDVVPDLEELLI